MQYSVYAPKNSTFYYKLKEKRIDVKGFKSLTVLYIKIFLKMLILKNNLFLNEAGHISYIKILARLLPFRKFIVSVRLLEDCNYKINTIPKNITLVPVSNFIKNKIKTNGKVEVVYDPYKLSQIQNNINKRDKSERLIIGVIGRITQTKGLDELFPFIHEISVRSRKNIELHFYGSYDNASSWFINFQKELDSIENLIYCFKGFTKQHSKIYKNCNLILHLNKVEALGRIIFEAIDYNVPFLCYDAGGCGELVYLLGFSKNTIDITTKTINKVNIEDYVLNFYKNTTDFSFAKKIIRERFSPENYAKQIEQFF